MNDLYLTFLWCAGNFSEEVKWFRNGDSLDTAADPRITIVQNDDVIMLTLNDAQLADCGEYEVHVEGGEGRSAMVFVNKAEPTFTRPPLSAMTLEEGQPVVLTCAVAGKGGV